MAIVLSGTTNDILVNGISVATDAEVSSAVASGVAPKVDLANFIGTNQVLSGNGYQKMPGGLIIQWGTSLGSLTSTDYRAFPIAFPNACLVGCAGYGDFESFGEGNAFVIVSKSQFLVTSRNSSGAAVSGPTLWIAIGY